MIIINIVALEGRAVNIPTLEIAEKNGRPYCKVRMAVKRPYKYKIKNPETAKDADFFDVMFYNNLSKYIAKHLAQGALFSVQGRLVQNTWKDGMHNNRETYSVFAEKANILEFRKKGSPDNLAGEFEDLNLVPRDIAGNLFNKEMDFDEDVPTDFL